MWSKSFLWFESPSITVSATTEGATKDKKCSHVKFLPLVEYLYKKKQDLIGWAVNYVLYIMLSTTTKAIKDKKSVATLASYLWWNICATKARFKLEEPSTMSFGSRYLLQSIFSACSRTKLALSVGSLTSKVAGLQCSGASTLRR